VAIFRSSANGLNFKKKIRCFCELYKLEALHSGGAISRSPFKQSQPTFRRNMSPPSSGSNSTSL
jgi:hypothetical protein